MLHAHNRVIRAVGSFARGLNPHSIGDTRKRELFTQFRSCLVRIGHTVHGRATTARRYRQGRTRRGTNLQVGACSGMYCVKKHRRAAGLCIAQIPAPCIQRCGEFRHIYEMFCRFMLTPCAAHKGFHQLTLRGRHTCRKMPLKWANAIAGEMANQVRGQLISSPTG